MPRFGLLPTTRLPSLQSKQALARAIPLPHKPTVIPPSTAPLPDEDESLRDRLRRRRRTEWKRRQRGQTFLDNLIVSVHGGSGGDGCVAFHREKFVPNGPPSGGNGGRGGDVYIMPTPHLTTLSGIAKRIRGPTGGNGQGTWQNGKNAEPLVIHVPLGTVVREIPRGDSRRSPDEWEAEQESLEGLDSTERVQKMRDNRWVHYPRFGETNLSRDSFKDAEQALYAQERERRYLRRQREKDYKPLVLSMLPLGARHREPLGFLIASGGTGGLGNPHFMSQNDRIPRFATRGHPGERITLALELKILADVGFVGMPNAGKSTLLRALTGGRAKSEVASYAFTTLNPVVGIVRVADDGTFEGSLKSDQVYDETIVEEMQEQERIERGELAHALTRNQSGQHGHHFDAEETFRFTIADNPGLISDSSENVGLGHSFLRSMERSLALAYIVDLSGPAPWDELLVLRAELEKYQHGMSRKARIVIANKADLLGGEGDAEAIALAKSKLRRLELFVQEHMIPIGEDGRRLEVVPVSAKYSQNLTRVVGLMRGHVQEARDRLGERTVKELVVDVDQSQLITN
ncbi:putative GTP-binding protein P8A3.11c, mitochondrial [Mycena indigotica]|uniref:Putative GTP-binding protein P8A3.11c, mitochondrial n=1 Tax=Mycena indigotica TaxID=2126181 RepID=A0A8H6WBX3_9AGAR|nr:putative GTP-binding protein P8A3.11c, mitochondrial [Mycena indigotica]KAF7312257.1 putative GTP-binding protein P8A3.11c, mitochondrial [Mycena indigotica]